MNTEYKTAEEYRQRMIEAFHNADCDHLIALVCLPNEKEFTHLEWLLKHELPNISTRTSIELYAEKLEELKEQIDKHIAELKGDKQMTDANKQVEDDLISKSKLIMHLSDFAYGQSPDNEPDIVKEYTAKDMQTMVYRTIQDCIRAVEECEVIK